MSYAAVFMVILEKNKCAAIFFLNHFRGFFKWTTTKQSSLVYCFLNESQVENAIHNELSEGIKIHSPLYISSICWIQNSTEAGDQQ